LEPQHPETENAIQKVIDEAKKKTYQEALTANAVEEVNENKAITKPLDKYISPSDKFDQIEGLRHCFQDKSLVERSRRNRAQNHGKLHWWSLCTTPIVRVCH
jgi:hypothetical protein